MSKVLRVASRVAVLLLALFVAATVWPTLYRYDHTRCSPTGSACLIRINRVTGRVAVLMDLEVQAPTWKVVREGGFADVYLDANGEVIK
jgi:hypothetical protein